MAERRGRLCADLPAYGAHLGRFDQTDPLGLSGDGPNLYAYVLDDPVNLVDPLGLAETPGLGGTDHPDCIGDNCNVIVTGHLGIQLVIAWELPRNMRPERSVVGCLPSPNARWQDVYQLLFAELCASLGRRFEMGHQRRVSVGLIGTSSAMAPVVFTVSSAIRWV